MSEARSHDSCDTVAGRVAVLCFSSAGELDVVLPLFCAWKTEDYTVFVFKSELLTKIRHDSFYSRVIADRLRNRVMAGVSGNKLRRWLQFIGNSLRAIRELWTYDHFLFEFGNSGREKNVLIALLVACGRGSRVLFYPHGHAVTPDWAYAPERMPAITRFAVRFGARIIRLDGSAPNRSFVPATYPILRPEWIEFVRRNAPQLYSDHLVILSRDSHPQYLSAENRVKMLSDAVSILSRRFPGCRIILRAHPREFFEANSVCIDGTDVEVTYENTYAVVRGARFAVSFWTSAFFQCLALGVPVVEYHVPHDRFLEQYPGGSLNAAFIPCCRSRPELAAQIDTHMRSAATLVS